MIVGEHTRDNDLEVNVLKGKKLTNIRTTVKDEAVRLTPPIRMTLEKALAYIEDDELVEVTPKSIRLRKRHLDPNERKRAEKAKQAVALEPLGLPGEVWSTRAQGSRTKPFLARISVAYYTRHPYLPNHRTPRPCRP